jgi:hypothetical protein
MCGVCVGGVCSRVFVCDVLACACVWCVFVRARACDVCLCACLHACVCVVSVVCACAHVCVCVRVCFVCVCVLSKGVRMLENLRDFPQFIEAMVRKYFAI